MVPNGVEIKTRLEQSGSSLGYQIEVDKVLSCEKVEITHLDVKYEFEVYKLHSIIDYEGEHEHGYDAYAILGTTKTDEPKYRVMFGWGEDIIQNAIDAGEFEGSYAEYVVRDFLKNFPTSVDGLDYIISDRTPYCEEYYLAGITRITPKNTGTEAKLDSFNVPVGAIDYDTDEAAALDAGKLDTVVEVQQSTPADDVKEAIEEKAKNANIDYSSIVFLDIKLFTTIDGSHSRDISNTNKEISITIKKPSNMNNCNEFHVVRKHNDEVDILDCTYDASTDTITFKTDKFSDYALIGKGGNSSSCTTSKHVSKKKASSSKYNYAYLAALLANDDDDSDDEKNVKNEKSVSANADTFASEMPAKTVVANNLFDLKVHSADEKTTTNQMFLAKSLVGANVKMLLTENIYPRRDLSATENGSLQSLAWNNLPKNQAGPVFAVVYNQTDGAYTISGTLDTRTGKLDKKSRAVL